MEDNIETSDKEEITKTIKDDKMTTVIITKNGGTIHHSNLSPRSTIHIHVTADLYYCFIL